MTRILIHMSMDTRKFQPKKINRQTTSQISNISSPSFPRAHAFEIEFEPKFKFELESPRVCFPTESEGERVRGPWRAECVAVRCSVWQCVLQCVAVFVAVCVALCCRLSSPWGAAAQNTLHDVLTCMTDSRHVSHVTHVNMRVAVMRFRKDMGHAYESCLWAYLFACESWHTCE